MTPKATLFTLAVATATASFTVAAQQRDAMKACEADVKTYCANVERGEGRIAKCLKENESKVSAECKAQMEKLGARMKERRGQAGRGRTGGAAPAPSN
jgi:hypothetical protein